MLFARATRFASSARASRSRWLGALFALPIVLCSGGLQDEELQAPAKDIDELIERVGELESFRSSFRVLSRDGEAAVMHWTCAGDDQVHVQLEQDGELNDMVWISGGVMTMNTKDERGKPYVVGADLGELLDQYVAVNEALDEHFPTADMAPLAMHLTFTAVFDVGDDRTTLSVGLSDRAGPLFGWLAAAREDEPEEQEDEALFVFERTTSRWEISAQTGFIERAWLGAGEDRRPAIELVELELNLEIDESEFEAPSWTETDERIDLGFARTMRETM